jgi:hypothetical protein
MANALICLGTCGSRRVSLSQIQKCPRTYFYVYISKDRAQAGAPRIQRPSASLSLAWQADQFNFAAPFIKSLNYCAHEIAASTLADRPMAKAIPMANTNLAGRGFGAMYPLLAPPPVVVPDHDQEDRSQSSDAKGGRPKNNWCPNGVVREAELEAALANCRALFD